ncbi:MAG: heme-degrading domain-containing protein [Paracoccaceae bacterium]
MDTTTIAAQSAVWHLPAFSDADAWTLGNLVVDLGKTLPIVINIRTPNRTLFHAALPGSAALNDRWALRKSNLCLLFGEPSFLIGLRNKEKAETLSRHGLSPEDYADAGGSVPIIVGGLTIAAVTVSGLPQAEDHALVIKALQAFRGYSA